MKKLGIYFAAVAWWWLCLYLVGSFIDASFDPSDWEKGTRIILGMIAFSISVVSATTL